MQISMFAMAVNQQLASMTVDPMRMVITKLAQLVLHKQGTYFVMIRAYSSYSGLNLDASF